MIVIGLTGSVGMGKTQVSKYFKKMNIDVFDSDYQVKLLYEEKNIIKDISYTANNIRGDIYLLWADYGEIYLENQEIKIIHP